MDTNGFTTVELTEQVAVEGGIVALEYLLVMTIVGLGLVVGVSAVSTQNTGALNTSTLSMSRTNLR